MSLNKVRKHQAELVLADGAFDEQSDRKSSGSVCIGPSRQENGCSLEKRD